MQKSLLRVVTTSVIGNALEFYDFTLIGVMISQIALTFFPPTADATGQLFFGFFAFGAAFLTRPFGASLFGYLGDRYGRRMSLSLSVTLMGFPALIIGFLPGYATIGLIAPVILVLCRLCQGVCMGGELNGAAIFALEHAGTKRPGFISGLIVASCIAGAILATLVSLFFKQSFMPDWAWRVPFILGACISILGYFLRRSVTETPEYLEHLKTKSAQKRISYLSIFKQYTRSCVHVFMIGAYNGIMTYTLFGFLTIYLSRYVGAPQDSFLTSNYTGYIAFMIGAMLTGMWGDKIGASQSVYRSTLISLALMLPSFYLMQMSSNFYLFLGQVMFGGIIGGFIGATHSHNQSLFPVDVRFRGIAVSFCLGISLSGCCVGIANTWLVENTHNLYAPAFLIMAVGFICLVSFPRKTALEGNIFKVTADKSV